MQLTLSSWQTLSTWRYSRTLKTTRTQQGRSAWLTGRPSSTWWVWAKEVPGLSVRQYRERRCRRLREHHLWMGRFLPRSILQYMKTNSLSELSLSQASSCFFKAHCSVLPFRELRGHLLSWVLPPGQDMCLWLCWWWCRVAGRRVATISTSPKWRPSTNARAAPSFVISQDTRKQEWLFLCN